MNQTFDNGETENWVPAHGVAVRIVGAGVTREGRRSGWKAVDGINVEICLESEFIDGTNAHKELFESLSAEVDPKGFLTLDDESYERLIEVSQRLGYRGYDRTIAFAVQSVVANYHRLDR